MRVAIKSLIKNFTSLDIYEKIFISSICLIFIFFFIQNFVFSSSFDILLFRSVDDYAFQYSMRSIHENMMQLKIDKLFITNDYGYGWIFWIIHSIITFPFYLISILGYDFLLISMARNISLFFMAGSCFLLFKISKKYTNDKYIPYFIVLFFISYPFFAISTMSFRTIAQCSFFCILAFYLTIKNDILENKDLKYLALTLSACIGTKLSTAIIFPLIALFLIDRYKFKINKENIKKSIYFLVYLIFFSILFTNPSLFLSPFKHSLFNDYATNISYHLNQIKTNYGDSGSFLDNLINFSSYYLNKYLMVFCLITLFVKAIFDIKHNKKNKFDFLYIFLFINASLVYIILTIKIGASYIANYFFSFSFLLLLSLISLNNLSKKIKYITIILLLILNCVFIDKNNINYHLEFFLKKNNENTKNLLESQKEMQNLVGDSKQKLNILADYRAPMIYSGFKKNITVISLFDNINIVKNYLSKDQYFDYILLHRDSIIMNDENDFNEKIKHASLDIKNNWTESRDIVNKLLKNNIFMDLEYQLIYDKNRLMLFKKL